MLLILQVTFIMQKGNNKKTDEKCVMVYTSQYLVLSPKGAIVTEVLVQYYSLRWSYTKY